MSIPPSPFFPGTWIAPLLQLRQRSPRLYGDLNMHIAAHRENDSEIGKKEMSDMCEDFKHSCLLRKEEEVSENVSVITSFY